MYAKADSPLGRSLLVFAREIEKVATVSPLPALA
jgi:hypothetical protein